MFSTLLIEIYIDNFLNFLCAVSIKFLYWVVRLFFGNIFDKSFWAVDKGKYIQND